MKPETIFNAVNMVYVMAILLGIAFLLAYIASKQSSERGKKQR